MRICLALALSFWAGFGVCDPLLVETGRIDLGPGDRIFGGLSGIELAQDGKSGWIIGDRGHAFAVTLRRSDTQRITGVEFSPPAELARPHMDIPIFSDKDTEGLAVLPSGAMVVSLEVPARLWVYPQFPTEVTLDAPHFDLGILLRNTGLEALAVDTKGRLITITEHRLNRWDPMFPVLRLEDGVWSWAGNLPKDGPFLPVGADLGPDGLLYVLERTVSLLGFRSRVRRFDPDLPNPKPETLLQSRVGQYDNLEGIAAWQTPDGELRLTTVSDNNFLNVQRSEIVEFRLQE